MSLVALIRHGATDWNAERRLQGRTDRPLSQAGREEVRLWRLPPLLRDAVWASSPLARARETAMLLGAADCAVEERLIEMGWGAWEGMSRAELIAMTDAEAIDRNPRGRDFRAPGGESPREVARRVRPWIAERARSGAAAVAVTHRGVIRALYAEATGWDMTGPAADIFAAGAAQLFLARTDGSVGLIRTNLRLA
jgi:broad specificity phosphatase PhoE